MKILHVIPYFTPKRGGDVNVCYNLSKQLVKRGHEVTIITTDFELDKGFVKSIEKEGVIVIPFHCIANIRLFLFSPSMKKWLNTNLRHFDLVHMHDFRSYQNKIVHFYAIKYNIPYILQAHGSVLPFFQKKRLKTFFDQFFGYAILKNTSKVIALTNTEVEQYKKMGVDGNKIEVVPNGIDLSEYNALSERGEFRRKHWIKYDEKIILYVGRLHRSKGIDLLVKAFSEISKELGDVRLVLVGPDDGYKSVLENLIQELKVMDKVLFTGFVTKDEKISAFVDADVFVTPSFSGFPVTFLEACACNTPIITTNNGDELDWIHNKVGYVVEYDKDLLRDSIFKVLSDEELRRKFGLEGKQLIRECFEWSSIIKKIEKVYERCYMRHN